MLKMLMLFGAGLTLTACATTTCEGDRDECIEEAEADSRRVEEEKRKAEDFKRKYGED